MRGYNPRQVDEYVARSASQIRDLEARLARALDESEHLRREISVVRQQALAGRPAHEEVSERISQILRLAEDEAKAQKGKADREVTDLRADAQRESDVVRTDAREQAERMLTAAQEQAERTITAARAESEGLRSTTHTDADRLTAESRQQADSIISDARAQAKRLIDEAAARAAAIHDGAERRLNLLSTRHGETVRRLNDILEGVQGLISSESSRMSLDEEVRQSASAAIAALEPVKRTENTGPAALGSAPSDRGHTAPPAPPGPPAPPAPATPPASTTPPAPQAPSASGAPSAPSTSAAPSTPAPPSVPSTPLSAPAPAPAPPSPSDPEATLPVSDSTLPLPGTAADRRPANTTDSESTLPVSGRTFSLPETMPPPATTGSGTDTGRSSQARTSAGPTTPATPGNEPLGYSRGGGGLSFTSSISEPASPASSGTGLPQRTSSGLVHSVTLNPAVTSDPSAGDPSSTGQRPETSSPAGYPLSASDALGSLNPASSGQASAPGQASSSGQAPGSGQAEETKASEGQVVQSTASPVHAQLPTATGRHATSKPTATPMPAATPRLAVPPSSETDTNPGLPAMPRRLGAQSAESPRNSLPIPSGLPRPGGAPAESNGIRTGESQPDDSSPAGPRRTSNPPGFPDDGSSGGFHITG